MPAEPPSVWGGVFTRFEDVDRNSFALVSFDEVSHAVEAQRRLTAGKLEAERRAAQYRTHYQTQTKAVARIKASLGQPSAAHARASLEPTADDRLDKLAHEDRLDRDLAALKAKLGTSPR